MKMRLQTIRHEVNYFICTQICIIINDFFIININIFLIIIMTVFNIMTFETSLNIKYMFQQIYHI